MTDYTELVKALRCCIQNPPETCVGCTYNKGNNECNVKRMIIDASAAIEELQAKLEQCTLFNTDLLNMREMSKEEADEILEYLRNAPVGPIEPMLIEQLPKRGKWVEENRRPRSSQFVCSECHRTAYDPQPTRDKAWRKRCRYAYCPNCGAKMEVQE